VRREHLDQPLILQPEIGILGFLLRINSVDAEVLVQAKPEPGNIRLIQAAPTVQATESNYLRRHQGRETPLLSHFLLPAEGLVISDSLQSEQGTRFMGKYNRNMVVVAPSNSSVPETEALRWFPIAQLLSQLCEDFQINTDARSVLATTDWAHLSHPGRPFARWRGADCLGEALLRSFESPEEQADVSLEIIIHRLERVRGAATFEARIVSLDDLTDWEIDEAGLTSRRPGMFGIRYFSINTTQREVPQWDQPLAVMERLGEAILLCQERRGILHFLFRASGEIGFREKVQYGPTIQDLGCSSPTPGDAGGPGDRVRELADRSMTLLTNLQSDEGGRFFQCVSRYSILLIPSGEPVHMGQDYSWMTLGQIATLIRQRGVFSNEARSLVSMLLGFL
jgi:oxidase EvaA